MPLVVAEISGNHGGDLELAEALISAAATAGGDLVKFQYYRALDMPDADVDNNRAMYERLQVPERWLSPLFATARLCGVGLFASVFSVRAVEELIPYKPPFYKFASPLSTPVTGPTFQAMADKIGGSTPIIMTRPLHRTCDYALSLNRYIPGDFGLSDHAVGLGAAMRALMDGAKMVERHFKLNDDCIDAAFSSDIDEFSNLCRFAHRL